MIMQVLLNQYEKCLNILSYTIENYNETIWFDNKNYKSPVWQIVYHALFYANIYCCSTEQKIINWEKQRNDYNRFEKMRKLRSEDESVIKPYTNKEMLEFLNFVKNKIPQYLSEMKPDEKCWPNWYNESQLEFQINNIRHLQHHIGEIIERHDIVQDFKYTWE